MTKVIHKYVVPQSTGVHSIPMVADSTILSAQMQYGQMIIWAENNTSADFANRQIGVASTGVCYEFEGEFIGTVQDSGLVSHLYDLGEG